MDAVFCLWPERKIVLSSIKIVPIKVLHVYKTFKPVSFGGVESFIDTLCKADSKLSVKNTILTLHPKPQKQPIEMDGYTVHQVKQNLFIASTGFSLSAFSKFKKLARKNRYYPLPLPKSICGYAAFGMFT